MRELAQISAQIAAVLELAHIVVDGRLGPIELQHVAAGPLLEELQRRHAVRELPGRRNREARILQDALSVSTIIFQPVAIGAAADDHETVPAQRILQLAPVLSDVLEQDKPLPPA